LLRRDQHRVTSSLLRESLAAGKSVRSADGAGTHQGGAFLDQSTRASRAGEPRQRERQSRLRGAGGSLSAPRRQTVFAGAGHGRRGRDHGAPHDRSVTAKMKEPAPPFGAQVPLPSLDLKVTYHRPGLSCCSTGNNQTGSGGAAGASGRHGFDLLRRAALDGILLLLVASNEKGRPDEPGRPPTNPEALVFGRATCTRGANHSNGIRACNVLKAASFRFAHRRVEHRIRAGMIERPRALPKRGSACGRRSGPVLSCPRMANADRGAESSFSIRISSSD
jgi:hypothetical protein